MCMATAETIYGKFELGIRFRHRFKLLVDVRIRDTLEFGLQGFLRCDLVDSLDGLFNSLVVWIHNLLQGKRPVDL